MKRFQFYLIIGLLLQIWSFSGRSSGALVQLINGVTCMVGCCFIAKGMAYWGSEE